ncbi:MAG: hypothetical protein ACLTLX_05490, partial [Ruthenibacterium lactatiformans]
PMINMPTALKFWRILIMLKNSLRLFFRTCGPSPARGHPDKFLLRSNKNRDNDNVAANALGGTSRQLL